MPDIDPNAPIETPTQEEAEKAAAEAAAAAAAKAEAAAKEEDDEEPYVETIKLKNGKDLVFEADSPEALRDKVFEWIRENAEKAAPVQTPAQATPATPAAEAKETTLKKNKLSQDEEFAINTEFKEGSPIQALEKLFQKRYGMTMDEVVEAADTGHQSAKSVARERREISAVSQFRENHPEYVGNDANKRSMQLWLSAGQHEATLENLEKAYTDLTTSGVIKNEPAPAADTKNPQDPDNPNPPTPKTRKAPEASALWGRRGITTRREPPKKGPTDADLQKAHNEGGSEAVLAALQASFETQK